MAHKTVLPPPTTKLQLYTIQGQLVGSYDLMSPSLTLSTAGWPTGIYWGTLGIAGKTIEAISFSVVQ